MEDREVTYAELFELLQSLGFSEHAVDATRRSFEHAVSDTVLFFSATSPNQPIRDADYLSAEVHLLAKGLIDEPLDVVLQRQPVRP